MLLIFLSLSLPIFNLSFHIVCVLNPCFILVAYFDQLLLTVFGILASFDNQADSDIFQLALSHFILHICTFILKAD